MIIAIIICLILGLLDGGLSFLFRERIFAENLLNNWMGTVNVYIFGLASIVIICLILYKIIRLIRFLEADDGVGCLLNLLVIIIIPILALIFIITYVLITFIFPNIIVTFKTNIFLYYAGSVILIIGALGALVAYKIGFLDFDY